MQFFKYQALGNDYLVIDPAATADRPLSAHQIRTLCHRHYGLGSDGILWGPTASNECDFGLRIYNPDGGEAEKSGNGLRIFSRYLADQGLVGHDLFTVETKGGRVEARVHSSLDTVSVDMGQVSFKAADIPVIGEEGEVLRCNMSVAGRELIYGAATVGNPHCIIFCDDLDEKMTRELGALIEIEPRFPDRVNVQFLKVLDRANIALQIWERGSGFTLACGSAASASAAMVRRLDLCDSEITVHMPGGQLEIKISQDYFVNLTGPVMKVAQGTVSEELLKQMASHRDQIERAKGDKI